MPTPSATFKQSMPVIVSIALAVLIAYWFYAFALPALQTPQPAPATVDNIQQRAASQPSSTPADLHLFGKAAPVTEQESPTSTKLTKLALTLRGILATDDPKKGLAQIQHRKEEKYFAVGDKVFGSPTLVEVYIDRVILLNNGQYETLLLPEEFLNTKHFESAKLKQMRKQAATNYRDLFLRRNGAELIKLFGFDTVWKNGGLQGFVIRALGEKGKEMMKILGVMDGDIIVAVNGLRFSESLEASAQLKDLRTATEVDVIILRDGEEIPFHLEFDTPVADKIDTAPVAGHPDETPVPAQPSQGPPQDGYRDNATGRVIPIYAAEDDEEDLGEDWGESQEAEEFRALQKARTYHNSAPVEYDH